MQKLSQPEFTALLNTLLIDTLYPDYIHIPGLGIRMTYTSYLNFIDDLYKAYNENSEKGIVLFFEKLKKRQDINLMVSKTKKLLYSHFDTIGIKDEKDKQEYYSGIVSTVENLKTKGI